MSDEIISTALIQHLWGDSQIKSYVQDRVKAGHVSDLPETKFPLITLEFTTTGRILVQTKVSEPFATITCHSEKSYTEAMVISGLVQNRMHTPINKSNIVISAWLIGTPVQLPSTQGESEARSYGHITKFGLGVARA